ncbi:sulfur carrier protein ThiS [bacterium]|nr:sulfur carrier protein ThiS [bacterium]
MNVTINGHVEVIPDGLTVLGVLSHKKVEMPDMVSVELNGDILDRTAFETTGLHEGDTVEFLYFMGGGQ